MSKRIKDVLLTTPLPPYVRDALGHRCAVVTCQRQLPLLKWDEWLICSLDAQIQGGIIGPTSWVVGCPEHAALVVGRLKEQLGVIL
jgi:hypothetical protein